MTTTKAHDNLNRLASITAVGTGSTPSVASYLYSYNAANQRVSVALADGSYWVYEYDSLGQVKSGKRYWNDGTPVAGQQFEYAHDDMGNRTSTKAGGNADRVAKAALSILGSHARVRRVRAFDYGTHVPSIECFVLSVAGADPRMPPFTERLDSRTEDCILEQPSRNGLYTNTCMILGGGEDDATGVMGYHRGCAIRDNYVNNESVDRPVAIVNIQFQGGVWVVTTRAPHERVNGDWVVLSGAVDNSGTADTEGRSVHFNGTFQISGVTGGDPFSFQITPAGSPATSLSPVGEMWVGRYFTHRLSVKRLDLVSTSPPVAKMTTYIPHNKKPGDWVNVYGVTSPPPAGVGPYYGRYKVLADGMTTTELKYQMDQVPVAACVNDTGSGCAFDLVFMGVNSIGFSTDGGSEAVAEGNAVFQTNTGGSYHDTYSTKDQTDRNNYYSNVLVGPQQSMTGTSAFKTPQSISVSGTTVTFTTTAKHGFVVGQGVGITPLIGFPGEQYFSIQNVTDFSFQITVVGVVDLSKAYRFAGLWQVGLAVREGNVIEIGQVAPLSRDWGPPFGVIFYSEDHKGVYYFQRAICRDNSVGLLPGSKNSLAGGFQLRDVGQGLIESNVIDVIDSTPWEALHSGQLFFERNQSPSGSLAEPAPGAQADDIALRIQEALLMAL